MRWIAIVMGMIAAVVWVGVIATTHSPKPSAGPPPDAALGDAGQRVMDGSVDAGALDAAPADGTPVDVAFGVRFVVPRGFSHDRVDKESIVIARHDVTFVVAVPSGAQRLKHLATPIDGVVGLAKTEGLRVVSISTDGPDRTLGKLEGFHDGRPREAVLFILTAKTYRVVVFLHADGVHDAAVDQLVDEIVHGQRLLLP